MNLIELDLVDGNVHDCVPQHLVMVQAFDKTKNDHFPDAGAFVLLQNEDTFGHVIVDNTFENIGESLRLLDPSDWFESTTLAGDRVLLRRSSIIARRSADKGSVVTIMTGGGQRIVELVEDIRQLRETMGSPTYAEAPPGLQLVETED